MALEEEGRGVVVGGEGHCKWYQNICNPPKTVKVSPSHSPVIWRGFLRHLLVTHTY